jgi:glycosyltransferase involved in cell wall biosynthesis
MQTITILIPVYNNASTLVFLTESIQNMIKKYSDFDIRILFADDASTDNSLDIILNLKNKYDNISVLILSNNHTQQYALYAAVHYIKSDYGIYLSADIQEEITIVEKYLNYIINYPHVDLFLGYREQNNDLFIFRFLSKLFYKVIRLKMDSIPAGGYDTGCAKLKVIDNFILKFKQKDLIQSILIQSADSVKLIPYKRQRSSSEKVQLKSVIFKIKYFIFSMLSVYFYNEKKKKPVYYSVKQYIP